MTPQQHSWLALSRVSGLAPRTLRALVDRLGSPQAVQAAPLETLCAGFGLRPEVAGRLRDAGSLPAARIEARLVEEHGAYLIGWDDEAYPPLLRNLQSAPPLLYAKGSLPADGPYLAVVGTREPSAHGQWATRTLVAELAVLAPAVTVVSGLARGIDTLAHAQALASGLRTVAVMAGGLSRIYPPENEALAAEIVQHGALLTEFSMTQPPVGRNFPVRNRIISGLCAALLVVEAGEQSGALITAGFAQAYGRPVFAVPGNLDQPASQGTNRWIQTGQARLVRRAADLLPALYPQGPLPAPAPAVDGTIPAAGALPPALHLPALHLPAPHPPPRRPGAAASRAAQAEIPLAPRHGPEQERLLGLLRQTAMHPDELAHAAGLAVEVALGLLLELELSGDIVQTRDNKFALS